MRKYLIFILAYVYSKKIVETPLITNIHMYLRINIETPRWCGITGGGWDTRDGGGGGGIGGDIADTRVHNVRATVASNHGEGGGGGGSRTDGVYIICIRTPYGKKEGGGHPRARPPIIHERNGTRVVG